MPPPLRRRRPSVLWRSHEPFPRGRVENEPSPPGWESGSFRLHEPRPGPCAREWGRELPFPARWVLGWHRKRSEEHTSELQSLTNPVCRLLLEKKAQELTH